MLCHALLGERKAVESSGDGSGCPGRVDENGRNSIAIHCANVNACQHNQAGGGTHGEREWDEQGKPHGCRESWKSAKNDSHENADKQEKQIARLKNLDQPLQNHFHYYPLFSTAVIISLRNEGTYVPPSTPPSCRRVEGGLGY